MNSLNEKLDVLIELAYQRGRRDMKREILKLLDTSETTTQEVNEA